MRGSQPGVKQVEPARDGRKARVVNAVIDLEEVSQAQQGEGARHSTRPRVASFAHADTVEEARRPGNSERSAAAARRVLTARQSA